MIRISILSKAIILHSKKVFDRKKQRVTIWKRNPGNQVNGLKNISKRQLYVNGSCQIHTKHSSPKFRSHIVSASTKETRI